MFGGLTLSPISLNANLLKTPPLISKWAGCNVNCETKCPVKVHTQDGILNMLVLIMKVMIALIIVKQEPVLEGVVQDIKFTMQIA
ncbi:hypothetical protein [Campylobacter jejuni]|uniref:hypothetical protein n=1 Tax=Campylobacter jejuni TaxID=197 RepID=UPI002085B295|nr:hypothetical protein [Campylobacter jejuni]GKY53053.1 hypothetical protein THJ083_06720 [Campylobacter jejuni]